MAGLGPPLFTAVPGSACDFAIVSTPVLSDVLDVKLPDAAFYLDRKSVV